jgi:hypothetical protein
MAKAKTKSPEASNESQSHAFKADDTKHLDLKVHSLYS